MANILDHKYFNLNNWVKNMTSFPVFINTYVGGVNTLKYQGGGGYERIYIPITVEQNKDYTFKFNFCSPTGFSIGDYGHNAEFAFIRTSAPSDTGGALDKTNLAVSANWNTTASEIPTEYKISFNSGSYTTLYVALDFGYILDEVTSEFVFSGIALDDGITSVKRLTYIESTGVQYINTDIIPTINTRVELKCAFREVDSQDVYMILTGDNYGLPWVDKTYNVFNWGWLGFGGPSAEKPIKDQIYVFEAFTENVPVVVINGNRYEGTSITPFSSNVPMHLFGYGGNPANVAMNAKAAVYYCKIWEGNRIIRDFIPALDKNNIACLYDNITEAYFYNQGTGVFSVSAGETLRSIESDGTQYINLEYIHTANTKIELDCYVTSNTQRSFEALLGSRYKNYQNNAFVFFTRFGGEDIPVYNRSGYETKGSNFPYNQRIKLTCYQKLASWIAADGSTGNITAEGIADTGVASLFLFDLNNAQSSGNINPDNSRSVVRIHGLKIYEDDILVRDYIPTLDINETACLYEQIESRAYYPELGNPLKYQRFGAYLIRSNSTLYTVVNGALSALTETEVTANLFQTYGIDEAPNNSLLMTLTNPELLYWQNSKKDLPILKIKIKGTPPLPQTMITQPYEIPTSGIKYAEINATEDILFSISFDRGQSWLYYVADGKDWIESADTTIGMTAAEMMAIPQDMWYNVSGTATQYQIRFALPTIDSKVTSIIIHYLNS